MVFKHHLLIMSKCHKSKDLAIISKLCRQELKHAPSFWERMAPPHCFDGMYSLQSLMYEVQDFNMECHCTRDLLARIRYGGLKVFWR